MLMRKVMMEVMRIAALSERSGACKRVGRCEKGVVRDKGVDMPQVVLGQSGGCEL